MSKKFIDKDGLKAYHDNVVKALNEKADVADLDNYLPKTGGAINGDITVFGTVYADGMQIDGDMNVPGNINCDGFVNATGIYTKGVAISESDICMGENDDVSICEDGITIKNNHGSINIPNPSNESDESPTIDLRSDNYYNGNIGAYGISLDTDDGAGFEVYPEDGYLSIYTGSGRSGSFTPEELRISTLREDNKWNYTEYRDGLIRHHNETNNNENPEYEYTFPNNSGELVVKSDVYTKSEVDNKFADKATVASLGEKVTTVELDIVDKANKSDVYTKTEVNSLIANAGGGGNVDLSDYLPLSGGKITGDLTVEKNLIIGGQEEVVIDKDGITTRCVTADRISMYNNGDITIGNNNEVVVNRDGISVPAMSVHNGNINVSGGNIYLDNGCRLENSDTATSGFGFNQYGYATIFNEDDNAIYITKSLDHHDGWKYTFPEKDGTVVLEDDVYTRQEVDDLIPTYYMHTISITAVSSVTTCNIAFMVLSKSATAFTTSTLYSTYGSKAFAASGYYGTNVVSKLAFTSSTQARFVYGSNASTTVAAISTLTDTVIPVV